MKIGLENKSVKEKLIFTSMVVIGLAIVVSLLISMIGDVQNTRQSTQKQLIMSADMVAASSASALLFQDEEAAMDMIKLLSINELIVSAKIVDQQGKAFVGYQNQALANASWLKFAPSIVESKIVRPIQLKGQSLGMLEVRADTTTEWKALISQWLMKLFVLSVIFFISLLILRKTSHYVLGPIQNLANAIREIINSGDYSLRVKKHAHDELGNLTEEFNLMLSQIEDRDNQLQQSNEALAQVQEPILLRDADLRCQYLNPAFTARFGYTINELTGTTHALRPDDPSVEELSQAEVYEIAKEQGVYRGETLRQAKNGEIVPVHRHISPVKDKLGEVKGYVTVLTDISEKKRAEAIIWRQANFDTLTGLPNRFMFMHRLKEEISKIKRSKTPLALMFLDLDRFKEINDTLGHDMGDRLLKQAGSRIVSCLRGTDTIAYLDGQVADNVARLGGDEFTIILNDIKESNATDIVAKRVLEKLSQPFQLGEDLVYLTASIGIVETYPNESINTETLIKYADIAMYESKQQGRNRYSKFSQSMLYDAHKRRNLINDIHKALKNNEFQVVYQPIINLRTNKIIKAEALIRWHHPIEGLVNPNDFISVAEDAGLIVDIGDWVFKEAVKQLAKWRHTIHQDFQISINKSPIQLNATEDAKIDWFDCLAKNNLPGNSVVVEITEGVFLNKSPMVTDRLSALRNAGIQISLDDFGTGYSSLSYLLKMDIDYIKIDQSFVKNLSLHSEDMILCEAMIVMAHKLGIKVVAEGIETQEQLDILNAFGCDYGQGYMFAKPLSSKAFERLCHNDENELITI